MTVQVEKDNPVSSTTGRNWKLYGQRSVLVLVSVLLAGIVVSPLSLSAHDIIAWAGSQTGLGLTGKWPWVVFYALDATAVVCVLLAVYSTWRAESGTIFRVLVWAIAAGSAFANWRYGQRPGAPNDAVWFFPAMSLSGPVLLEVVLHKARYWIRKEQGRAAKDMPHFGFWRWIPAVGATRETYGAWRTARLKGISSTDEAIQEYRRLCPDGGVRVLRAIQEERKTKEQQKVQVQDNSKGSTTEKVQPVQAKKSTASTTTKTVQVEQEDSPVLKTPKVQAPSTTPRPVRKPAKETDSQRLEKIKQHWPDEIPSGNKVRVLLGVNYQTAERLLIQLKQERAA